MTIDGSITTAATAVIVSGIGGAGFTGTNVNAGLFSADGSSGGDGESPTALVQATVASTSVITSSGGDGFAVRAHGAQAGWAASRKARHLSTVQSLGGAGGSGSTGTGGGGAGDLGAGGGSGNGSGTAALARAPA